MEQKHNYVTQGVKRFERLIKDSENIQLLLLIEIII